MKPPAALTYALICVNPCAVHCPRAAYMQQIVLYCCLPTAFEAGTSAQLPAAWSSYVSAFLSLFSAGTLLCSRCREEDDLSSEVLIYLFIYLYSV